MENSSLNWQDSLNSQLLQRLVLLGQQPGIIKQDIGQKIIDRCDRFLNLLPLLSQYLQRWQGLNEMSVDSVPIVYALPALRESENNEIFTVNEVNNLASNTEKTIQTKTESSQTPSAASNDLTEKREPNIANSIVIQPSTVNEIAPAIEMPLVTNSESLEAIATSSNQTYSLINNSFKKEDPLPIAKIIDRNSNFSERKYLIVNPLLQENSSKLLSENKSIQQRPLSLPISSTNSSLINDYENTKQTLNRSLKEPITEEFLEDLIILAQVKIKLPVVKNSHQYPSENIQNQLPIPPFSSSKMPRINVKTVGDRPAIAAPLPLASRSPSLPSSANFDVPRQSPQQSPEVPKVFAASSPPTETRISPMQTTPPKINLEAIADQVERKIMRRLVIESERRGQKR